MKKNRIILGGILFLLLFYCVIPVFVRICERSYYSRHDLQIRIENVSEKSYTELWLAQMETDLYSLEDAVEYSPGGSGNLEYRDAGEYGYAFDFLVSYGNYVDAEIVIFPQNMLDTTLHFYTVGDSGGQFRVSTESFTEIVDTTASSGTFIEVSPFAGLEKRITIPGYILSFLFATIGVIILTFVLGKYVSIADREVRTERMSGIDVIRLAAICFVIMVHALFPAGYYENAMDSVSMFGLTYLRSFLICCVPLFMTLTGYLNLQKELEKKYYKKLVYILITYVIICMLYEVCRVFTGNQVQVKDVIDDIFLFQHSTWYVSMYIGIFLLTPFLNFVWRGAHSRKNRAILLLILVLITSLHTVTNNYVTYYWQVIYPITYYFAGCYLATYEIRIKKKVNAFLLLLLAALQAANIYFSCWKGIFNWGTFGGYSCSYNALPTVCMVILLFALLDDVNIRSGRIRKILQKISGVSLEIYLLSVMLTDDFLISVLHNSLKSPKGYFLWIIPYRILDVAICFIIASGVSLIVRKMRNAFNRGK